jgi:hypothetical protein
VNVLATEANSFLEDLQAAIAPLRTELQTHPVYDHLRTLADVQTFMQQHVFAVWDFMSLLKWLQTHLTCARVPWLPTVDPLSRRLINEIVLAEESDEDGAGGYASHLELYLAAMEQCSASTVEFEQFLARVSSGVSVDAALQQASVPSGAAKFVRGTFRLLDSKAPHAIAAGFALGREDLIPGMFRELIIDIDSRLPGKLTKFRDYLQRHVELDEEHHTPLALRMLCQMCGDDPTLWFEAQVAVKRCFQERQALWDAVLERIEGR